MIEKRICNIESYEGNILFKQHPSYCLKILLDEKRIVVKVKYNLVRE